jgi:hypothetical protein
LSATELLVVTGNRIRLLKTASSFFSGVKSAFDTPQRNNDTEAEGNAEKTQGTERSPVSSVKNRVRAIEIWENEGVPAAMGVPAVKSADREGRWPRHKRQRIDRQASSALVKTPDADPSQVHPSQENAPSGSDLTLGPQAPDRSNH